MSVSATEQLLVKAELSSCREDRNVLESFVLELSLHIKEHNPITDGMYNIIMAMESKVKENQFSRSLPFEVHYE